MEEDAITYFSVWGLVQIFGMITWRINDDDTNNNIVNNCTNEDNNIDDYIW